MPLNLRDPNSNSNSGAAAHTYPTARAFAFVVLGALAALFIMHHFVFTVSASGGVK